MTTSAIARRLRDVAIKSLCTPSRRVVVPRPDVEVVGVRFGRLPGAFVIIVLAALGIPAPGLAQGTDVPSASPGAAAEVDGYAKCGGEMLRFVSAVALWSAKKKEFDVILFRHRIDERILSYWRERTDSFKGFQPDDVGGGEHLMFDLTSSPATAGPGDVQDYALWIRCPGGQRGYSRPIGGQLHDGLPRFEANLSMGGPFALHVERNSNGEEWNLSVKGAVRIPPPTMKASLEPFRPPPYRTKEDLARALVAAVNAGSPDDLWATVHPGCLTKISAENRAHVDQQFRHYYFAHKLTVYDWAFARVRAVEPMLREQLTEYPVRPSEILTIDFDTGPNASETLTFPLLKAENSWYLVIGERRAGPSAPK